MTRASTETAAANTKPRVAIDFHGDAMRSSVVAALHRLGIAITDEPAVADVLLSDRADSPGAPPLVVIGTAAAIASAIERGAAGGLRPTFEDAQLMAVILAASAGLVCTDVRADRSALETIAAPAHALADETDGPEATATPLTPRETEVLALMTTGATNKQIARALSISVHTAKFHVAAVIAKLGASGRTDAVVRAIHAGQGMV